MNSLTNFFKKVYYNNKPALSNLKFMNLSIDVALKVFKSNNLEQII